MTLEELGRARGRDPFDAIADLMIEEDGNVGQFVEDISGEEGIATLVKHPEIAFITRRERLRQREAPSRGVRRLPSDPRPIRPARARC